ncbi:MAG: YqeG family HAD IIIA-type phosphatase [Clostridia bacterium]|nr:YqeG family HAD IIIA-type phosphatase [Clostridia bacterium]
MFLKRFFPTYIFESVQTIPYETLEKEGIKAIIFDMDNTLVDYKYEYVDEIKVWLAEMNKKGIKFCILSNTPRKSKAKLIAEDLGMKYIVNASKPWSKGFKKAIDILRINKDHVAIVGDQIFTDIWGGNRFGIKTILVKPVNKREIIVTRVRRPLERYVLRKYYENSENGLKIENNEEGEN